MVTLVSNVPGGCSDSITRPVTINAKSDPSFTISRQGRTVTCTPKDTDPTLNRSWRFGEGSSSTVLAPVHTYANVDKGTFQICQGIINVAGCLSESCQDVNLDLLDINELNASDMKVYPNPSKGLVTVSLDVVNGPVNISVFNLLGEMVYSLPATDNSGIYSLNLTDVADGIYVVQVNNGTKTSVNRVTISH